MELCHVRRAVPGTDAARRRTTSSRLLLKPRSPTPERLPSPLRSAPDHDHVNSWSRWRPRSFVIMDYEVIVPEALTSRVRVTGPIARASWY